jgi:hypothetical protein
VRGLVVFAAALAVTAPALGARPQPAQFLSWSRAHRAVHLTLLAGLGSANGGFNFDGYGRGELDVRVPLGWRVVVDCENRGGLRHSCAIVRGSLSVARGRSSACRYSAASTAAPTKSSAR